MLPPLSTSAADCRSRLYIDLALKKAERMLLNDNVFNAENAENVLMRGNYIAEARPRFNGQWENISQSIRVEKKSRKNSHKVRVRMPSIELECSQMPEFNHSKPELKKDLKIPKLPPLFIYNQNDSEKLSENGCQLDETCNDVSSACGANFNEDFDEENLNEYVCPMKKSDGDKKKKKKKDYKNEARFKNKGRATIFNKEPLSYLEVTGSKSECRKSNNHIFTPLKSILKPTGNGVDSSENTYSKNVYKNSNISAFPRQMEKPIFKPTFYGKDSEKTDSTSDIQESKDDIFPFQRGKSILKPTENETGSEKTDSISGIKSSNNDDLPPRIVKSILNPKLIGMDLETSDSTSGTKKSKKAGLRIKVGGSIWNFNFNGKDMENAGSKRREIKSSKSDIYLIKDWKRVLKPRPIAIEPEKNNLKDESKNFRNDVLPFKIERLILGQRLNKIDLKRTSSKSESRDSMNDDNVSLTDSLSVKLNETNLENPHFFKSKNKIVSRYAFPRRNIKSTLKPELDVKCTKNTNSKKNINKSKKSIRSKQDSKLNASIKSKIQFEVKEEAEIKPLISSLRI